MKNVPIICLIYRVYGPEDSQETVFEEVKPLLTSLLDGWVSYLIQTSLTIRLGKMLESNDAYI